MVEIRIVDGPTCDGGGPEAPCERKAVIFLRTSDCSICLCLACARDAGRDLYLAIDRASDGPAAVRP